MKCLHTILALLIFSSVTMAQEFEQIMEQEFERLSRVLKVGPQNSKGDTIFAPYERVSLFQNGLAPAQRPDHKWGMIDTSGNVVVDFIYSDIVNFHNTGWVVGRMWV